MTEFAGNFLRDAATGVNALRVETTEIKPGESGTAKVIFGYAYGRKPSAKLNTAEITKLVIFNNKSNVEQLYRIESIVAGGLAGEKPPVNPNDVRTKPVNGAILGNGTTLKKSLLSRILFIFDLQYVGLARMAGCPKECSIAPWMSGSMPWP